MRKGCLRAILVLVGSLVVLCISGLGAVWYDNRSLPTQSEPLDRLSVADKVHLAEAIRLKRAVGDRLLPGWSSAELPFILFNEQYAFLVDVDSAPPDGWQTVPQGTRHGGAWEAVPGDSFWGTDYYRVRLPAGISPQNFTVRVGDQWASSLNTHEWMRISLGQMWREELPTFLQDFFPYRLITDLFVGSSEMHIAAILHESAHALQGYAAGQRLAAGEQANHDWQSSYPWEDKDLQAAWQKELDLLHQAMRAATPEDTRDLASQFIAQRDRRRAAAGFGPQQVGFERNREWVEGIGKYAERMMLRLAADPANGLPVAELQSDQRFSGYRASVRIWANEEDQMRRMAGAEGDGRFYYSGWAQAVLLDRLSPGWQARLFEDEVWLEDLLRAAVALE